MAIDKEVERTLGRILATQELILKQLESHTSKLDDHVKEDREILKRVEQIEHRFSYLYGIAITIGAIFTFSSDIILKLIGLK